MHTDRCGNARRQNCRAKGSRKDVKIQQFRYRVTANVELKCAVIPAIVGASGMETEGLGKNL
jgi:hypothetical protein